MSRSNELSYRFRADSHPNGRKRAAKLCTSGISDRREGSSNPGGDSQKLRHSGQCPRSCRIVLVIGSLGCVIHSNTC